jgi:hypothetical protein
MDWHSVNRVVFETNFLTHLHEQTMAYHAWCITPIYGHSTAATPGLEREAVRSWNVIHQARESVITPFGVYL